MMNVIYVEHKNVVHVNRNCIHKKPRKLANRIFLYDLVLLAIEYCGSLIKQKIISIRVKGRKAQPASFIISRLLSDRCKLNEL